MQGTIIYGGPSVLNGEPIVAIATFNSKNAKTGNMVQTWIMADGLKPTEAAQHGNDESVCGMCPHRHHLGGGCYVVIMHGPGRVYHGYRNNRYPPLLDDNIKHFHGRKIRLGSYGDPAAVPFEVWKRLADASAGLTGYTHQISHPNFDNRLLEYCMVSADTEAAAKAHQRHGRRTFRVLPYDDTPLLPGEVMCPADPLQGVTCLTCGACDGASRPGKSIAIAAHGMRKKRVAEKFGYRLDIKEIS